MVELVFEGGEFRSTSGDRIGSQSWGSLWWLQGARWQRRQNWKMVWTQDQESPSVAVGAFHDRRHCLGVGCASAGGVLVQQAESPGSNPKLYDPSEVTPSCHPSTWKRGGEDQMFEFVPSHRFQARLGYMKPCLKTRHGGHRQPHCPAVKCLRWQGLQLSGTWPAPLSTQCSSSLRPTVCPK